MQVTAGMLPTKKSKKYMKKYIRTFYILILTSCMFLHQNLTAQNISLVKEINTAPNGSSNPNNFTVCNNNLYFFAADNSNISSLWVTLGTDATTQKIFPAVNVSNSLANLICFNNKLFFSYDDGTHGQELFTSDGTQAGTSLFIDIIPGSANSFPQAFTVCNSKLYFAALDNTGVYQLYVSDGTVAGTVALRTVTVLGGQTSFAQLNNEIYFMSNGGNTTANALWKTDGTIAGTVLLKQDIVSSAGVPGFASALNLKLYFNAFDNLNGSELWVTDGSTSGTHIVVNLSAGNGDPQNIKTLNGKIYFNAQDDVHGKELFGSDGTAAGTYLVKDILPGSSGSNPNQSIIYNGLLYLMCAATFQLWQSDGTDAGTVLVKSGFTFGAGFKAVWNNKFYFTFAGDYSLWQSDGTTAGTIKIQLQNTSFPVTSYTDFGSDSYFTEYNAELYLNAQCFQIANGFEPCKLSAAVVLPLTWLGIQAQWQNSTQATVSWQVADQQNIRNYTVQKSIDGITFINHNTITATAQTQYSNVVPATGNKNYFRVKETDVDGRVSYSKIVVLQKNDYEQLIVFPNPSKNVLHLSQSEKFQSYQVLDLNGKVVMQHSLSNQNNEINISNLPKASYLLKLLNNGTTKTVRFLKQ